MRTLDRTDPEEVYRTLMTLERSLYTRWFPEMPESHYRQPIVTKQMLRQIQIDPRRPVVSTTGSTGEPLRMNKTAEQQLMLKVTNTRELLWRGWDVSKNLAVCSPRITQVAASPWFVNPFVFPHGTIGTLFTSPIRTIEEIQTWLDRVKPDYLHSLPSVIAQLDTSKLIDVKSTGEQGGTMYSSSECGTIGITCPDNPNVYHVMENIFVEIDDEANLIVTDTSNPFLTRYLIGDKGAFARCTCGRRLQTLDKRVLGRVRNMALHPLGGRFWPKFGTQDVLSIAPGVTRMQCVQDTPHSLILKLTGFITPREETTLKTMVRDHMGNYDVSIQILDQFPAGKFEEFVCLV